MQNELQKKILSDIEKSLKQYSKEFGFVFANIENRYGKSISEEA